MKYTEDYNRIFAGCRILLDSQITEALEFIRRNIAMGRHLTLGYLCLIAEFITAYNELNNLTFFAKTKHFKRID